MHFVESPEEPDRCEPLTSVWLLSSLVPEFGASSARKNSARFATAHAPASVSKAAIVRKACVKRELCTGPTRHCSSSRCHKILRSDSGVRTQHVDRCSRMQQTVPHGCQKRGTVAPTRKGEHAKEVDSSQLAARTASTEKLGAFYEHRVLRLTIPSEWRMNGLVQGRMSDTR